MLDYLNYNYYCAKCDDEDVETQICKICKKHRVRYYKEFQKKSDVIAFWNEINKTSFFLSEKTALTFIFIGISILVIILFIYIYASKFNTSSQIDHESVNSFGTILGGLIGSLWTLASIILFYNALKFQKIANKNEMEVLNTQVIIIKQQMEEQSLGIETKKQLIESNRNVHEDNILNLQLQEKQLKLLTNTHLISAYLQISNNETNTKSKQLYLNLAKDLIIKFNNKEE